MTSLTVAIGPTSVGSGRYLWTSTDTSCPSQVLDVGQAISDFDDGSFEVQAVGVSTIAGQTYVLVYANFTDTPGDPAVYYITYPGLTIAGRSIVPSSDFGDGLLLFGPPVFDNVGGMWTPWYNPGDNHDWLTHTACPGVGVDFGTTPDDLLVDFGDESGLTPLRILPIGWNPYDDRLYYIALLDFAPYAAAIHRINIADGDSTFTAPLYASGRMLTFTPDGALWTPKQEFSVGSREAVAYRVASDGTFAASSAIETANLGNDSTQALFPFTDNSVLYRGRTPTFLNYRVASDLSFATSTCDITDGSAHGTALIATGLIGGAVFLPQVQILDG